jgi:hypothetical protein
MALELKVSNLNYEYEIVLYEIHQFRNRVANQMVTISYNVQPMCKNCKMPNTYDYENFVIHDL